MSQHTSQKREQHHVSAPLQRPTRMLVRRPRGGIGRDRAGDAPIRAPRHLDDRLHWHGRRICGWNEHQLGRAPGHRVRLERRPGLAPCAALHHPAVLSHGRAAGRSVQPGWATAAAAAVAQCVQWPNVCCPARDSRSRPSLRVAPQARAASGLAPGEASSGLSPRSFMRRRLLCLGQCSTGP